MDKYGKLAKNTMVNSPFPLVIAETNGNMIWKSNKFTQEFANIDINNILGDLLKQIKLEIENNEESTEQSIHKELEIGNKIYEILGRYKAERDTFVCIFEQRYLAELEEKKFNILDTIKELELSDKIQITLSISVSTEGQSNYEKYKSAQAGLDIALGRGGDQTVVRENGKYQFFGGRTQELEKRTKVKA